MVRLPRAGAAPMMRLPRAGAAPMEPALPVVLEPVAAWVPKEAVPARAVEWARTRVSPEPGFATVLREPAAESWASRVAWDDA
jgi:hypothetical protein